MRKKDKVQPERVARIDEQPPFGEGNSSRSFNDGSGGGGNSGDGGSGGSGGDDGGFGWGFTKSSRAAGTRAAE